MPKFNANLSMMFNEVDFLERFAAAAKAGFKGVEFLFPYAYDKNQLAEIARKNNQQVILFNMPPGDWNAGDRGMACDRQGDRGLLAQSERARDDGRWESYRIVGEGEAEPSQGALPRSPACLGVYWDLPPLHVTEPAPPRTSRRILRVHASLTRSSRDESRTTARSASASLRVLAPGRSGQNAVRFFSSGCCEDP
jgi:hypothetical protein